MEATPNPRPALGAAGGVLHRARREYRDDVRLLQRGGELDFPLEPLGAEVAASSVDSTLMTTRRPSLRSVARNTRDTPAAAQLALDTVFGPQQRL